MVLGGDSSGHVGELADGYRGVHGRLGFGIRNTEGVRILKFGDALDIVVCNTVFKKKLVALQLKNWTYPSFCIRNSTNSDYCLSVLDLSCTDT